MPQTIYFDTLAQSPTASIVDASGGQQSASVSFVNGDTRAIRFYALAGTAASTDYTPTTHNLVVTVGQPGSSSTAVSYFTATASTGSGDYWDVTLLASHVDLTALIADGKQHDVTMEVKLVARTGGAEFTPVLKTVQIFPGLP